MALRAGALTGLLNQPTAQVFDGSLRFDAAESQYLSRTFGSGNRKTYTWSSWVKKTKFGDWYGSLLTRTDELRISNGEKLSFNNSGVTNLESTGVLRDSGSFYHVVFKVDTTTQSSGKIKGYINGVEFLSGTASFSTNDDTDLNDAAVHYIGNGTSSRYADYYLSQCYFIDGLALGPDYFGFTDPLTKTWRPKKFKAVGTTVNDGREWSANFSGNGGTQPSTAFDGGGPRQDGYVHSGSALTVNFSPPLSGHIIVYGGTGAGSHNPTTTDTFTLSDGSVLSSQEKYDVAPYWTVMDFGEKKNITSLVCSGGYTLYAVEVDGVYLKDSTTQNLDFGTNGFYLPLDNEDDFEKDKSGKGNDWTKNNFSGTSIDPDVLKDSPSGAVFGGRAQTGITTTSSAPSNYCVWNPLEPTVGSLAHGNLRMVGSSAWKSTKGTISVSSGKWYYEGIVTGTVYGQALSNIAYGIGWLTTKNASSNVDANTSSLYDNLVAFHNNGGYNNFAAWQTSVATLVAGDVIGVALDKDSNTFEFFRNGSSVLSGTLANTTDDLSPWTNAYYSGSFFDCNFGQKPFKYAPPQGYLPLNSASVRPDNSYYEEHVELHVNYNTNCTYSNGNLTVVTPSGNGCARSGVGMHTGKYYAECVWDSGSSGSVIGIVRYDHSSSNNLGQGAVGYGYYSTGSFQNNGGDSGSPDSYANGDVIGIEFDATNGTLDFYKNGSSQGEAFTGLTSPPYYFAVSDGSSGGTGTFTYRFKESSFTQSIPSGAIPLHRDLDAKKTVPRPDQYVGIVTYTGTITDTSSQKVTGLNFQSDLVWIKRRDGTNSHQLVDSVRGTGKWLESSGQARENSTNTNGVVTAIDSNGFTLTGGSTNANLCCENGFDYVAWCWKAGGSESTFNVDGVGFSTYTSVPSEYNLDIPGSKSLEGCSVGRDSGFSIVKWISTGNEYDTIPHGLGRQPSFVAAKAYSGSADRDWILWTTLSDGGLGFYHFNNQDGEANSSVKSLFTSKTFGVYGSDINTSGEEIVAYVWADTPGLFKAGAYESNNSTNGPFIELGFRPALILLKNSDSNSTSWLIDDAVRNKYNGKVNTSSFATNYAALATNSTSAEPQSSAGTFEGNYIDFLSNGFKLRNNAGTSNGSASTIIYYAWAASPFANLYGGQSNAR